MGTDHRSFLEVLGRWLRSPWPAVVMVTVITVATVGTIVLVTTGAGCKLGLNPDSARCRSQNAALVTSPSPSYIYSPFPSSRPSVGPPTASAVEPAPSPQTALVPTDPHTPYLYVTGASGAYPPNYPISSGVQPQQLGISCRLPIYAGGAGSGGFLVLPDGSFIPDPRSAVTVPMPPGVSPPPQQMGPGPNFYGLTYDAPLSKWLPVQRSLVSPDGKRYVFNFPSIDGIFAVDAATNAESTLGQGRKWSVIGVENNGAYATDPAGAPGLWLVPYSGDPSEIIAEGYWQAVGGGAAYGMTTSAVPNGVPNTLIRLDLKTSGATPQPWMQVTGATVSIFGFDQNGNALVWVHGINTSGGPGSDEIWEVLGLGKAEALVYYSNYNSGPVADSHGLWLASYQGIWLIVPGSGGYLVSTIGGQLAGPCI